MNPWKVVEKDEDPEGPYWVKFTDTGSKERFEWSAGVKWDGCIELIRRYNGLEDEEDAGQIHLCDMDELIASLQGLRAEAKKILGPRHGLYEE